MREKINKLAKGNIDDVKPLIRVVPERLDFVTQKGELIKADVLLRTDNHVPMKALAYAPDPRVKIINPSFGGETAALHLQFNYAIYDSYGCFSGEIFLVTSGGEFSLPYTISIKPDKNGDFFKDLKSVDDFDKIIRADENAALKLFQYKNFTDAAFMQDPMVYALYGAFSGRPDKMLAMHQFVLAVRRLSSKDGSDVKEERNEQDGLRTPDEDGSGFKPESKETGKAGEAARDKKHGLKYFLLRYYRMRLCYEIGGCSDESLVKDMKDLLGDMKEYEPGHPYVTLLRAENVLLSGDSGSAAEILSQVRSMVQNNRQTYLDEYFLMEYISCRINGDNSRRASFIRLLHKFITEEKKYHLFIYLIRTDDTLRCDISALYRLMHRLYEGGYRSPMLYLEYVRFLNEHPDYLHDPSDLDMNALFFGCRNDMLSQQLVQELEKRTTLLNLNNILYYPVFASLYKKTQSRAFLQAICSTLIRADRRDAAFHHWYAAGVAGDVKINGIYEYYLYSMTSYDHGIDETVLAHFSGGDNLDGSTRAKLYSYVVKNKEVNTLLYRVYEPKILAFTLSGLKEHRIDDEMAVLYHMLFSSGEELEDYYDSLPDILCTYRYHTDDPSVKAVAAIYPQLRHEQVFLLNEKHDAYIPVISDDMAVLAQDAYGNRYCTGSLEKEQLFDEKELMDICRHRCQENLIIRLITVDELLTGGCTKDEQIRTLERSVVSLPLSRIYKAAIDRKLIDFYGSELSDGYKSGYMQDIKKAELDRRYRIRLIEAQIRAGLYREAFTGICEDGFDDVHSGLLRDMCTKLIGDETLRQQEQLLSAAYETVRRNLFDRRTLDYLCENYNGSSASMYDVLEKSIDNGIDTCDLEERLLAQLIFTDDRKMIDQVFTWYVERKRASEQIIKAYFTIRTYRYFLYDEPTDASVFEYIESVISSLSDPAALPVIQQFALTRFYSEQEECSPEQVRIAKALIDSLFLKGYYFPYFKKFERYFKLPDELKDDVMMVYPAQGTGKPYVMTKLDPYDKEFKPDNMKKMYKSLYVLDKILFADEELSYEIYEIEDGIDTLKVQGTLKPCSDESEPKKNRFSRLNEMIKDFESGDEVSLRQDMDGYLVNSRMVSKLFGRKK